MSGPLRNIIGRSGGGRYIFFLDHIAYMHVPEVREFMRGATWDDIRMCWDLREDLPASACYLVPHRR